MRYLLAIAFCICINNFCHARIGQVNDTLIKKRTVYLSNIDDSVNIEKYYLNDTLVKAVSYYSNGSKKSMYHYKNGKLRGILLEWYQNGQLSYSANRSLKNGFLFYYSKTGDTIKKAKFLNGTGLLISYSKSGVINSVETVSIDEELVGLCQYWYENGVSKYITDYSKELRPFTEYYENGVVKKTGFLRQGSKSEGLWIYYSEEGEVIKEEVYVNGKLVE